MRARYLVGVLAALASKTGKVGFVGGMDIPLIQKFACGYVQGVKATNPDAEVFQNMTGTTGAAWNDPVRGGELAKSQIDRGADVVYHAAGGTGIGVLQAAADAGVLGIGVDSNQNYVHPGQVLTSMLKRVDNAVYDAMMDVQNGEFTPGVQVMGLAEDGVGYALDDNNKALITPEMQAAVEDAQGEDHLGRDRGARLHRRRCLPGLLRAMAAGGRRDGRGRRRRPSPLSSSASPRASARSRPTRTSTSPSAAAPSTASSARTAPASRR